MSKTITLECKVKKLLIQFLEIYYEGVIDSTDPKLWNHDEIREELKAISIDINTSSLDRFVGMASDNHLYGYQVTMNNNDYLGTFSVDLPNWIFE